MSGRSRFQKKRGAWCGHAESEHIGHLGGGIEWTVGFIPCNWQKKKKKDLRVVSPRVVDENMDMDNKKHGDNIKIISGLKNVK